MSTNNSASVILGCDPRVIVTVNEKDDGGLFITLTSNDPAIEVDLDGLFLNLTDESLLGSLSFFPEEDSDFPFAPVTDITTGADAINATAAGDSLRENYDIRVEYGTTPDSTQGIVSNTSITIGSDQGPLTVNDIDLNNIAVVVNGDNGNGQVLLPQGSQEETQLVEKVVLEEDFNDIHDPDDSDAIESDGYWGVRYDKLFTNGCRDGDLVFEEVETDGPVSFTMDAKARNIDEFEATGRWADSLRVEVQIDGGDWVLLDEFRVNDEGTALVGSETGQEIGPRMGELSYSGGVLDEADNTAQFRMVSDISAYNERIIFDNVQITATEEVSTPGGDGEAQCIDFNDLEAGDVVANQYDGVTISAQRDGDSANSENDAMIFDSNNPTGRDWDLHYSNQDNILIVSEDNDSDDPDDEAHGGAISFAFESPAEVLSLAVLDIEEEDGYIDLFDENGDLLNSVAIPITGNNGAAEVQIDTANVSTMNVVLSGSGAIDDLCYVPADDGVCDSQYGLGDMAGFPMIAAQDCPGLADDDDLEDDAVMA